MAAVGTTNTEQYNYDVIKQFTIMSLVWAVVGMTVGVYIASELAWPALNFDIPYITFGRLRPVHTGAVIFRYLLLHRATYLPSPLVQRRSGQLHFLGLAADHRASSAG
jgi:cbb3-type cytochrome oxidase subunit 1